MQEKTQYVRVNQYTRPGLKNYGVRGIVWHYTASPGASAQNIRDYFDGTCIREKRYASAHDVIDAKQVIHMIPHNEVAYHAHDNNRCMVNELDPNANYTAIGVELCIDKNGKLEDATYRNAVEYGAALAKQYKLDPLKHFFRHYDVTRKNCPAFWVADPSGFEKFKKDVAAKLKDGATKKSDPKPAAASKPKTSSSSSSVPYPGHLIKRGSRGKDVERVQRAVGVKVDGIFGPQTEAAVKAYQKRHGLAADGIVGPKTWAVMF